MKAAVIDSLERGPRFADFADPVVGGGEILVEVTAAGLHPITRPPSRPSPAVAWRMPRPGSGWWRSGQMAGPTIALPAEVLRSSGLQVLGSGPGTIPLTEIIAAIPQVMAIAAGGGLPIDIDEVPLAQVEAAWQRGGGQRIVLRP